MKKTLAALALAGSIALVGSAPAMAATYPALPPAVGVSDGTPAPGQTFVFTAQGFLPGETVTITITVATTRRSERWRHRRFRQDPCIPGTADAHRNC